MKSILFFLESVARGGAEVALLNIIKNLDKSQFQTDLVSQLDQGDLLPEFKQYTHHRSFVHQGKKPSFLRRLWNKLVMKGFVSLPPALVHRLYLRSSHDIEVAACEGYSTKIIANSTNKKSIKVAYVHTDFVANPWSESVYKGGAAEEQSCYEKFDVIVCVSQTIADAFIAKYGLKEKVRIVHNIINEEKVLTSMTAPVDFAPPCRPMFVQVGNILAVKGYERTVAAAAKLTAMGYNFCVAIAGYGYQQKALEDLIAEQHMQDRVLLLGFQENPYPYMHMADCYLCTSHAEGYSTAVCEAIISGAPVITTLCSGMEEIFGDSNCGIICENSEDGVFQAMKEVLDHPEQLAIYTRNAKKRAAHFSMETQIARINRFYAELSAKTV